MSYATTTTDTNVPAGATITDKGTSTAVGITNGATLTANIDA
jgi:hypothetical protein